LALKTNQQDFENTRRAFAVDDLCYTINLLLPYDR